MTLLRLVMLPATLALTVTACTGDDGEDAGSSTSLAPAQQVSALVAVRRTAGPPPYYNPPQLDLVELEPDGFESRALVESPRTKAPAFRRVGSPAWSADGERVFFTGGVREVKGERFTYGETDVFATSPDGDAVWRLTELGDVRNAVPSTDGRSLLLSRAEHQGQLPFTVGLWLTDVDGVKPRRLLPAEEGVVDFAGSWSPDGETIVFSRCPFKLPGRLGMQENTCDVFAVAPDGSGLRKLAERASMPAFSPDGEEIAFVSDRDENGTHRTGSDEQAFANDLYVMDADGSDARRLTDTESLDERTPAWHPDGSVIAYARGGPNDFTEQLMLVKVDGSCETRIAGDAAAPNAIETPSFGYPAWRPGRVTGGAPELDC